MSLHVLRKNGDWKCKGIVRTKTLSIYFFKIRNMERIKSKNMLLSIWLIRFFLLPPPAIYHLVPHRTPQQPALGDGWKPRIFILVHIIWVRDRDYYQHLTGDESLICTVDPKWNCLANWFRNADIIKLTGSYTPSQSQVNTSHSMSWILTIHQI